MTLRTLPQGPRLAKFAHDGAVVFGEGPRCHFDPARIPGPGLKPAKGDTVEGRERER